MPLTKKIVKTVIHNTNYNIIKDNKLLLRQYLYLGALKNIVLGLIVLNNLINES